MWKGKYAKGETADHYEFHDGLVAGLFRKKKGQAGVGKMENREDGQEANQVICKTRERD